jgi:hypothetical protein
MSKNESKAVNNRELIEVNSKFQALPTVLEFNIYTFLPVSEVFRVMPFVSHLFREDCKSFRSSVVPKLLTQHLTSTHSLIPRQFRMVEEEHEENCRTTEKVCFRFNFVYLGAVLAPIGIELVAPKGSPWHDTLMGVYSTVIFIALGIVAYRCLSTYCNNRQSRQKNYLEKQIKNLTRLSIIVESKNHENKNNNQGKNQQKDSGTKLSAVCAKEKSNTSSCQLRPNVRFGS